MCHFSLLSECPAEYWRDECGSRWWAVCQHHLVNEGYVGRLLLTLSMESVVQMWCTLRMAHSLL